MATLGTISLVSRASVQLTAGITADFANPSQAISEIHDVTITTVGTGADQANQYWSDQRTLAASGADNLDMSGGLTNALGQTIALTAVKHLYIRNRSTSDSITVGAATTNPWTGFFGGTAHTIQVRANGHLANVCNDATGWAVTGGSADVLRIANASTTNAITYDIVVVGVE